MNFCISGVGTLPPPTPGVCDNNLLVMPPQYLPFGPNGDFSPALGLINYSFIEGGFSSTGTAASPSDTAGASPAFALTAPAAVSSPPPAVVNPGGAFTGMANLIARSPGSLIVQSSDVYKGRPALAGVTMTASMAGFAFFPSPSLTAITNIQFNSQFGSLTNNFNFNLSPFVIPTGTLSPGAAVLAGGVVVPFSVTNVVTGDVSTTPGDITALVSIQPTVFGSGAAIYVPAEVTLSGKAGSGVDNSAILGLTPGFPFPGNGGNGDEKDPGGVKKPGKPPPMKNDAPPPPQAHTVVINEGPVEGLGSVFVDGFAVPVTFSQFMLPFATVSGDATMFTDSTTGAVDMGDLLDFTASDLGTLVRFSSDAFDPDEPGDQEFYMANGPGGGVLYIVNSPQEMPEPSTLGLIGFGMAALAATALTRRRDRTRQRPGK